MIRTPYDVLMMQRLKQLRRPVPLAEKSKPTPTPEGKPDTGDQMHR